MLAELEIEPGDPTEVFELLAKLGKGSYASVYKARDTRDGSVCAIKVLEVEVEDTKALIKEIRILKGCNSEFIVGYKGSYLKDSHLWLVMEYCGLGSICDIMAICQKKFNEAEIAGVMVQTLKGLDYLHKLKMIHRDIKSGNILLNENGDCKLADFGVSAELENTLAKRKTLIGTPYWMAPEVLQAASYDSAADIWSVGITAYEMAVGHPPHIDKHPLRAIFVIPTLPSPTLPEPAKWSKNFNDFLALCLAKNAKERPSAADLLTHPFLVDDKEKLALRSLVANCRDMVDEFRENQSSDEDSDEDYEYDEGPVSPLPTTDVNQPFDFDPSTQPIEVELSDSRLDTYPGGDTGTFHPSPTVTVLLEKVQEDLKREAATQAAVEPLPQKVVLVETKPSPKNTMELAPSVLRLDTLSSPTARLYRTQRVPDINAAASADDLRNLVSYLSVAQQQERTDLDAYYQSCKNTVNHMLVSRGFGTLVQKEEKSPASATARAPMIGDIGKTSSNNSNRSLTRGDSGGANRDGSGHRSTGSRGEQFGPKGRTPPSGGAGSGAGSAGSGASSATAAASSKSWQLYNEKNSRILRTLKKKPKIFVTNTSPGPREADERKDPVQAVPELAGYLYKRGKQSKEWLRRYFVLAASTLSYWHNEKDFTKGQNPRGGFTVRGAMVQVYPTGTSPFQDGGLEELKQLNSKQPRKSVFSTLRSGTAKAPAPPPSSASSSSSASASVSAEGTGTLKSKGPPPPPPRIYDGGDYSALGSSISGSLTPSGARTKKENGTSTSNFNWGTGTMTDKNSTLTVGGIDPAIDPREPGAAAQDAKDHERDWTVFSLRPVTLDRVYYLVTGASSDMERKQWLAAIEHHGGWLTQRGPDTRMRSQSVSLSPLLALSLHTPLAKNPTATRTSPYHTAVLPRSRRSSSLLLDQPQPPGKPR